MNQHAAKPKKHEKYLLPLFSNIFFMLSSYFVIVVIYKLMATHMDRISYVDVAIILKVVLLLPPVILLGSNLLIVRFFSEFMFSQRLDKVRQFVLFNLRIYLISCVFCFIVGLCWAALHYYIDYYSGYRFSTHYIYLYAIWLIPLFSALIMIVKCLQALKHFTLYGVFNQLFFWSLMLIFILLYTHFVNAHLSAVFAVNIIAISILFSILCVLPFFLKILLPLLKEKSLSVDSRPWWNAAKKYVLTTLTYAGINLTDTIMVRVLGHSSTKIAVFITAFQVVNFYYVLSTVFSSILSPYLSENQESGSLQTLLKKMDLLNGIKLILTLVFFILMIIFSHSILAFFSPNFATPESVKILILVALGAVIYSIFDTSAFLLLMRDKQNYLLTVNIIGILLVIILDLIVMPKYGVMGATIIFSIILPLEAFAMQLLCRLIFGHRTFFML